MRTMLVSAALLALGIVILIVKPYLGQPAATGADMPGIWPHWVAPVGYFACLTGAAGLFLGWVRHTRKA